jgi:mannose-1-phosphate guanylyltransferase
MTLRAVVLVGGEGTRLRPLTFTRPKPILPVCGIPMLTHKLTHLGRHGVTDAVLSLGYKPDAFLAEFPTGEVAGVRLHYAVEPAPLDTAGAIRFAVEHAGFLGDNDNDPIIAVNGDTLTDLDLTRQLAFHRVANAEATIALTRVEDPSSFGVVPTDADGRVTGFVEKPPKDEAPTDWINAGAYILERRFFDRIPPGERISIERITFPLLVAEGSLFAVQDDTYWIDAGIPSTYVQANVDMFRRSADRPTASKTVIGSGSDVVDSVFGTACEVGSGSQITGSVIHDRVRIGNNVRLDQTIIGNDVVIGDGAVLTALTVIGDGATVAPGTVFDGIRYPMPES